MKNLIKEYNEIEKLVYNKLRSDYILYEIKEIVKKYDVDNHTNKEAEKKIISYWNEDKRIKPKISKHRVGFILIHNLRNEVEQ